MSEEYPPLHLVPPFGTIRRRPTDFEAQITDEVALWCAETLSEPVQLAEHLAELGKTIIDGVETIASIRVPTLRFGNEADLIAFKMRWTNGSP